MKVLVACEESQRVCISFREKGHEAYSCDIQECSGGHPEWHIQDDCLKVIKSYNWDLLIAHPPCTYLTVSGARWLVNGSGKVIDELRFEKMLQAREFFLSIWQSDIPRICIENPLPMKRAELPPYSQILQPYCFGDEYSKRTVLWLKNLSPLIPTVVQLNRRSPDGVKSWVCEHRSAKIRSKTFPGIAHAMAQQWSF